MTQEERGFRDIGSLVPKTLPSPPTSDSTEKLSPPSSATTGAPSQAPKAGNLVGPARFEIAVGSWQRVRQAMEAQDADQVRVSVEHLLKPLANSYLRPMISADGDLEGYTLLAPMPDALLERLEKMARFCLRHSKREVVIQNAVRCFSVTKARGYETDDMKLTLAVLADELSEFPPDIVADVFKLWARREKWAPSLAELRDYCQREMRWRRSLMQCVMGARERTTADAGGIPDPMPRWEASDPWELLWQRAESPIERHMCVIFHEHMLFRANAGSYRFEAVETDAKGRDAKRCALVFGQQDIGAYRIDFLIAAYDARFDEFRRVGVECDGFEFHGSLDQQRRDHERDQKIRHETGLRLLRLTGKEIIGRRGETATKLHAAMLPGPDKTDPWAPWGN